MEYKERYELCQKLTKQLKFILQDNGIETTESNIISYANYMKISEEPELFLKIKQCEYDNNSINVGCTFDDGDNKWSFQRIHMWIYNNGKHYFENIDLKELNEKELRQSVNKIKKFFNLSIAEQLTISLIEIFK